MRRALGILGTIACLASAVLALPARAQDSSDTPDTTAARRGTFTILSFDVMTGNPGSTEAANVIRGFNGGGSPWAITGSVHGLLRSNGQLIVVVKGLVISGGQDKGQNPVPQFRAALSCQDPADATAGQLYFTDLVPATTGSGSQAGDATIIGRVALPPACFAPLIFIASPPSSSSPAGAWFAVTGY